MSWDQIVNTGSPSWRLIEGTQPSADLSSNACNGLPDVTDWENLTGAQGPNVITWPLKRTVGSSTVVDIEFELSWQFGAQYRSGGAFIPVCWIAVKRCNVGWGHTVQASVTVDSTRNGGSQTAPIAVIWLAIDGTIHTPKFAKPKRWLFKVAGNGAVQV